MVYPDGLNYMVIGIREGNSLSSIRAFLMCAAGARTGSLRRQRSTKSNKSGKTFLKRISVNCKWVQLDEM